MEAPCSGRVVSGSLWGQERTVLGRRWGRPVWRGRGGVRTWPLCRKGAQGGRWWPPTSPQEPLCLLTHVVLSS